MTYLLDSDQIISYLNGKNEVVVKINNLASEKLVTSVICVAEVLEGIFGQEKEANRLKQFSQFLGDIPVLPIDQSIAQKFARIRSDLRKKGNLIDNMDTLIAATAIDRSLVLVTRNLKHFKRIRGLKLYKGKDLLF